MANLYEKELSSYRNAPRLTAPYDIGGGAICPVCEVGFISGSQPCEICKIRRDLEMTSNTLDRLKKKLHGKVGDECDYCGGVMWNKKQNEKCKNCGKTPLSNTDFKYIKDLEKRLGDIKDTIKSHNISYSMKSKRRTKKSTRRTKKSTRRTRKSRTTKKSTRQTKKSKSARRTSKKSARRARK